MDSFLCFQFGSKLYFPMDKIVDNKVVGDIDVTLHNNPILGEGVPSADARCSWKSLIFQWKQPMG